jgi:hypothetical protein
MVFGQKYCQITSALCISISEYQIGRHQVEFLIVRLLKLIEADRLVAVEATKANAVTATNTVI